MCGDGRTADDRRMREQWSAITAAASAGPEGAAAARLILDELIAAHGAPDRHYHGHAHIDALLALVEMEANRFRDRTAVELAVLFHDAVYDARNPKGNEAASAALARDRLTDVGVDAALIDKVARYVEATAHLGGAPEVAHPPSDPDLARFLDLDLAILAASPADYDAYAAAIRREYAHVPEADWRAGRARVLRVFLERPRIYLCDDHHARWDAPARANLRREIAALTMSP